ncbi:MAG: MATE family efflux transporter [Clostridia bacterium]
MKEEKISTANELYHGPIIKKILMFAVPLMLTGLLQLLYTAVDMVVVGRFAGKEALSAVGSTNALINLFINVFNGLSLGASVVASRYFGSEDKEGLSQTVHTAIALSIFAGFILTIVGWVFARPMLVLMDTPLDVIEGSVLYLKIFFSGMIFNMGYNYGSALLRAVGDTKRPLKFLTIAGIINVVLNLIFVIVFNMGVAGVGFATIISQAVSMFLVFKCLILGDTAVKLEPKKIRFHKDKMIMLIKFGLPAGIQGCLFSLSNVLIQSSVNFFGTVVMAGNTASNSVETFLYIAVNSLNQSNITFYSQNVGAKKYSRLRKGFACCVGLVLVINFFISTTFIMFSETFIGLYTNELDVLEYGVLRLSFMASFNFVCALMHIGAGQLQAMGRSMLAMIITLLGVCVIRIAWVYTIFEMYKTIQTIYICFPITWGLTAFCHMCCVFYFFRKVPKVDEPLES